MQLDPNIAQANNAVGLLADIQLLQTHLEASVSWLQKCYGRAHVHLRGDGPGRKRVPALYTSGNKYEIPLPNAETGSFAFFKLDFDTIDPVAIAEDGTVLQWQAEVSLIVWYDSRVLYAGATPNLQYDAKAGQAIFDVLEAIESSTVDFKITRIFEGYERVFDGYDLDEVKSQHLSAPFYGFRLQGVLRIGSICG